MSLSKAVIPCFILDPRQVDEHPYRSLFALRFLYESLADLSKQCHVHQGKLFLVKGKAEDVVKLLLDNHPIDAVFVNRDYTPFSVTRDLAIKNCVQKMGKVFVSCPDALLHEPQEISKPDGSGPYTVYTPFYKRSCTVPVKEVNTTLPVNFYQGKLKGLKDIAVEQCHHEGIPDGFIKGGRQSALNILKDIKLFKDYDLKRNFPYLKATTHLSAHFKFGTVSIREVFYLMSKVLGSEHSLIKELYWRDFFTHIAFHFPHVFGHAFYSQYDKIIWDENHEAFKCWCDGKTGFPMVDAGMRELNQTGFMQNRVRMIVGSFLVKDLHCPWQWGERYFATKLVDYDPCVNNGNWQWVASTGCDRQPYYRIFNPWLQQVKFDPQALYIKEWVPELRALSVAEIHAWHERGGLFHQGTYLAPMVDHAQAKSKALALYQNIRKSSN